MVQTRNYPDFVAVQLAEIAAQLDAIESQMRKDVEELKTVMFGKPTTNQAKPPAERPTPPPPLPKLVTPPQSSPFTPVQSSFATDPITPIYLAGSEPEDEELVEGTIPSSPPFPQMQQPSSITETTDIFTSSNKMEPEDEDLVEGTATYTSPRHTAPSIKSPPSPTITLVLRVPSPVLFTTLIQRQTPSPRKACLVQPTVADKKPIKAPIPGLTTTLMAVFFIIVWDPGNNVLVHNNGLAAQFSYTRLEGKSSFRAGSIDKNPILVQGQTGSGLTQMMLGGWKEDMKSGNGKVTHKFR